MRTFIALAALLIPSTLLAIVPPARNGSIPDHLKSHMEAIRQEYAQGYWFERAEERRLARSAAAAGDERSPVQLTTDTVFAPILLGQYSNSTARFSPLAFQQMLFDGPNPSGTVTQYYWENSFGQLYFSGRAEGWFTAPRDFEYYVHDGGDRNAGLVYGGKDFTIDVLAVSDNVVDYAKFVKYYDSQGRGHVPQLGIVHTGADAASGASNIWSHRSNIRSRLLARKGSGSDAYFDVNRVTPEGWYITNDLTSTGKQVLIDGDYAIHPELSGNNNAGTDIKPIGVFVHEFGHVFGLPDLYDTDNSSEGLGGWCVMASGSYGGDQGHENYPANFSAWCKEKLGWVTPIVVSTFIKGQPIRESENYPEIYKLWRLGATGQEYFLVENRQKVNSDKYLLNSGLLVFHVDNSQSTNRNENRYLVDLMQADGNRDLNRKTNRGDAGDPYPGTSNNRNFDGTTNPNSNDYSGAATYVGVRNISASAMTMTADLDVGTRPYVVMKSFSVVEGSGTNNDGRVEPGEQGNLQIRLANLYPTDGTNLQLTARSRAQGVSADTTVSFSINALSERTVALQNSLRVDRTFVPQEAVFDIVIGLQGDTLRFADTTVFGYPSLLFVDCDSTTQKVEQYYRAAVDPFGIYHETYRSQGTSFADAAIDKRKTVFWFTGQKKTQTVPDSAQRALAAFLAKGGSLFITGQNIAEDLQATGQSFLQQTLHSRWSKNIALGRTVYGQPTDAFGSQIPKLVISGGNGASNQVSPDELLPDSLAKVALLYNSLTGSSVAGIRYEDSVSHGKVLFFGFGFEAINDSSAGVVSKQQVMGAILAWLNAPTGVPGDHNGTRQPNLFTLGQNYPNPFNPSTQIQYTLSQKSYVTLRIFNVMGQEVATLSNHVEDAGQHALQWNGTNSSGTAVSTGVYFYRIEVAPLGGGAHATSLRKMMLIR